MDECIPCFACGARSPKIEGECHKYMLSSPGCWAMFVEVMAKEHSHPLYWKGHQFTVDAYAVQHVGKKIDKRALNSVHIHLAALYAIFVEDLSLEAVPQFREQFSHFYKGKNLLTWLDPPKSFGPLTISEPWKNDHPELHFDITRRWARSAWESWSHQHRIIADLVQRIRS